MTQSDEPGELVVGLRYGRQSRWRWPLSLFRAKPPVTPTGPEADWVLAYISTGWTLRLRSCTPGDLDLPLVCGGTSLPAGDLQGALLWAEGVLPSGVRHTIVVPRF